MSISEIATVLAWKDALADNDVDTLLNLSSTDIEVGGADGASQGLDVLREWATGAGLTLSVGRMFEHEGIVVAEVTETWGTDQDGPTPGAAAFRVVDDQVTSIFRHPDLPAAFAATGLTEKDLFEG
ncbi:nuclear transport factor 2 family protein [Rhodococcus triatomae]|uniref:SnoaL-like domain-containing protein n=1 Tax=Rhodococcus triatomae TaxID=300028 RepID=A0A1G8I8L6_9NOCA|nr:nuclear transport factor 2 family protein [Rhodococcus triatomae]QNG20990.1 nuclear transport factor 2 family protein [Rhodococcus triatomae]QNG23095.1 nuclear transport factor 2 family protein [Rhodococcus triatomae]SDI15325.1 SnoaL-like domain-containing protein [Rhodococcus triatomae]